MKNLKAHHHLVIVSLLLFGISSVWTWGTIVFASSSGSQVQVYLGPPDSCPNIPGYQMTTPSGMLVDADGSCYTPPPPPVDMCGNIDGNQETIPAGYYRNDSNGNCYKQPVAPAPPVDVCANLDNVQDRVPDGYINDTDGSCVLPPTDMCQNIPGTQVLIPAGMERSENATCFTPAPVSSPTPPINPTKPDTPRTPSPSRVIGEADLKNIPAPLENLVKPLVDVIPESAKQALRSVPPTVARTFPYYVLGVLVASGMVMGWQSVHEVASNRKLASLLRREREIAEEKDTFIALASHYLRTPLTLMSGALSTAAATNQVAPETMQPLSAAVASLEQQVGSVLAAVENNTALKSIQPPVKEKTTRNFLTSTAFWLPIVAMMVIIALANFLLGVVGEVDLGTYNLIIQTIMFAGVSIFFYSMVRNYHLRRVELAYRQSLLEHEQTVDKARNDFIDNTAAVLTTELAMINTYRPALQSTNVEQFFNDGYGRFEHLLQKFSLLGEIQAGTAGAVEKFDIKASIDALIQSYQPQLQEKQLTLVNNVGRTTIKQRRSLFDFVLGSMVDNAIKFSKPGGTILISSAPGDKTLSVEVIDHGIGIPADKMDGLFKPFFRGTSTMEFNYEGLGFSLFLDKIIMDYVGGSITARSTTDAGTVVTMTAKTA